MTVGAWSHVVGTYDGGTVRLYVNGVQGGTAPLSGSINYGNSKDLAIGSRSPYAPGLFWNGLLDEVRISSVARSADWIATEYANQSSPGTFYSVGQVDALAVPAAPLPLGVVSFLYSTNLTATGGLAPYNWSITNGSLPAGLSLAASGAISGTPTATGTRTFTATVTDGNSASAKQSFTITVNGPLAITTSSLPSATQNTNYSTTLNVSGGAGSYQWSTSVGGLPAGLSLNASTGAITGVPTASGSSSFTVQVMDANSTIATQTLSLAVASPVAITTASLNYGIQGITYNATLAVNGGAAPYTWVLTAGSVPGGLSFSGSGVITGVPASVETSSFTVQVTDANGSMTTQNLSLVIYGQLAITTTSLGGATQSSAYTAQLTASGGDPSYFWSVVGALPAGLSLTARGVST
jgi:hypothetical protein